jgi:hypothetical protein
MSTATEIKERILNKATEDSDFRTLLIADPKAAILAETGMTLPDSFNVTVHEDTSKTFNLVLPLSSALTEFELEAVAGGGDPWGASNWGK